MVAGTARGPGPVPDARQQGRDAPPLARRLMLLVAAVAIPFGGLGAVTLWAQYGSARQRAETQLVAQARAMAQLVDREFERATTIANVLARSTVLARGDLDAFEQELRSAGAVLSADLAPGTGLVMLRLVRADGVRLLDTAWPPGERRGDTVRLLPHMEAALRDRRPGISDIFIAQLQNIPLVSIAAPVQDLEEGRPATAMIGIGFPAQRFGTVIAGAGLPPGGTAAVLDRRGITAAETGRFPRPVGETPPPEMLAAIATSESGLLRRDKAAAAAAPVTTAFARAAESGYMIRLDVPELVFLGPLHASLLQALLVGGAVLGGGLLVAMLLARRVVGAFQRVPELALLGSNGASMTTGLREADQLALTLGESLADRFRAEAALRDSEARFRTLTDAMPQIVWSALPNGQNDYFNARWRDFTGLTNTAVGPGEGRWSWLDEVHPEDQPNAATRWSQCLALGTPFEVEARLRRREGSYRWVLCRALPLRDEEGRILRWFGSSTEIQDIVEARDVLARGHAELERLVAERTRDLEATQARLAQAQRMEALGQLAGGIAHDFNNVLQTVQGGASLIVRRPEDAERTGRLGRMIVEAAERGASVTRRLLAFARRSALQAQAVDASVLLTDLRDILGHTLGSGIEVVLMVTEGLPPLLADKGQLETVLINLGTNARDAMGGSGMLILAADVEEVAGTIHPAGLHEGLFVKLSVKDSGSGMDPATLARASEPFFTTKPVGRGTGLGLSMAQGFAEQSGGAILIESALGEGTAIHLWFPVAEPVRPVRTAAPLAVSRKEQGCLLVVDDEALVREITAEQLESYGYTVITVSSGAAALDLLDKGRRVDLVVSDLSMPGMDGLALIQELQQRRPGLPAILLTGFASHAADIAIGGALNGNYSLLTKPADGERLAERVRLLLGVG